MAFSEFASHGINQDVSSDAPPNSAYVKIFDYAAHVIQYEGWAQTGNTPLTSQAIWAIKKYTYTSGDLTSITWADGNTQLDNIWDNRATMVVYQ